MRKNGEFTTAYNAVRRSTAMPDKFCVLAKFGLQSRSCKGEWAFSAPTRYLWQGTTKNGRICFARALDVKRQNCYPSASFCGLFLLMVKHTKLFFLLILGGVCAHLSCNSLSFNNPSSGNSATIASAVNYQPNTVTVEIYVIRLSPHQNALLYQLWQEVDEQSLPTQLRRELLAQGFRVGILGNFLSPMLEQLTSVSSEGVADIPSGIVQEFSAADVAREYGATRHTRQLLPEMHAVLKPFNDQNALPEIFLFRQENGKMHGETYTNALGGLLVSAEANRDGSAQIQMLPVLEHGVSGRRFRTVAGMVIQEESRPRHTFESLMITQRLLPGQWIILGATTLDSAGAGKVFFTRTSPVPEQRLLAIRLVRAMPVAE